MTYIFIIYKPYQPPHTGVKATTSLHLTHSFQNNPPKLKCLWGKKTTEYKTDLFHLRITHFLIMKYSIFLKLKYPKAKQEAAAALLYIHAAV